MQQLSRRFLILIAFTASCAVQPAEPSLGSTSSESRCQNCGSGDGNGGGWEDIGAAQTYTRGWATDHGYQNVNGGSLSCTANGNGGFSFCELELFGGVGNILIDCYYPTGFEPYCTVQVLSDIQANSGDDTCVLDPVAPGVDPDPSLIDQCHYNMTYNAALNADPPGVADRVTCETGPGFIGCNVTWRNTQGQCRIASCAYTRSDGLVCSPAGDTLDSECD